MSFVPDLGERITIRESDCEGTVIECFQPNGTSTDLGAGFILKGDDGNLWCWILWDEKPVCVGRWQS